MVNCMPNFRTQLWRKFWMGAVKHSSCLVVYLGNCLTWASPVKRKPDACPVILESVFLPFSSCWWGKGSQWLWLL